MTANEEYIRKNKVTVVDDDQNTRLHYAAAVNNVPEVEKMIKSAGRLDPENYLGWTPLMMAVRNACSEVVDLLLEAGANTTKKNKFGMNVFLISVTSGDIKIVEKILDHLLCGGVSRRSLQKEFSPISMSLLFQQSHIFKYFLKRSFDPNVTTTLTGITPLMFAAALENNKAINKLLQFKANPVLKNHLGKTAYDILQLKHKKIDIDSNNRKKKQQLPVILVSPHEYNNPQLQLTPYPNSVIQQQPRKSSNTLTPNTPSTPAVSPITPQIVPHMFFGPNFNPNQFMHPGFASPYVGSPVVTYAVCPGLTSSGNILNNAINPVFPTSIFPQGIAYPHSA